MNIRRFSNKKRKSKSLHHSMNSGSLIYDVKPLIKIALSKSKSKAFCDKTDFLIKHKDPKEKKTRDKLIKKLKDSSMEEFVDGLIHRKIYLSLSIRKILENYLETTFSIEPQLKKKVC